MPVLEIHSIGFRSFNGIFWSHLSPDSKLRLLSLAPNPWAPPATVAPRESFGMKYPLSVHFGYEFAISFLGFCSFQCSLGYCAM